MNNRRTQHRLQTSSANIEPSGDPLLDRTDSDGLIRIAYQNINGLHNTGFQLPTEIEAIESMGIDIMGMSETNCPWTPKSKSEFNTMMNQRFQSSRTSYSSAPPTTQSRYQPGGNLLTITGHTTGRIESTGSDPWGRFCWYRLRGRRDEGVVIITAYRVCHNIGDNPGPYTAFQQQYTLMRQAGIAIPNPRKQILTDLTQLIQQHRMDGYRPIVMMDANGDYRAQKGPDTSLRDFLDNAQLSDHFHDKFNLSPRTFLHGSRRIDYIFVDPAITLSIRHIGYLGTHEGADSDHCMAYVDIDECQLFHGLINRPVSYHSREILLAQADKVQEFVKELESRYDAHSFFHRVTDMAQDFARHQASSSNVTRYNALYGEFLDMARATAKKIGRKKYGYNRSPTLTTAGQLLLIHKHAHDCKRRRAPLTQSIIKRCHTHDISVGKLENMTIQELRKAIRNLRQDHWEATKHSETLRSDWLASVAKDRARALDDPNWERKLLDMRRTVKVNALNRKLTAIIKGPRGVLDRIQIPTHDWFYSPGSNEIYHYDKGVFEAYPAFDDNTFHTYHTIKIVPDDVEQITVERIAPHNRWKIVTRISPSSIFWRNVDSQNEIESHLIDRNRRHLEQVAREQGPSTRPPLTMIRHNYGINPLTESILGGTYTTYDLTPEMRAFFNALKSNPSTENLPPVLGGITSQDFQEMFRRSKEKTSSDSRTLNYSIWKCIASSDAISSLAAILLSLPFMYGFVNSHWTHMTDFMLEKKPGVRQIHQLRIIGKVAAEFNTCLKFFIGHKAMHNFEAADPCDSQHGFRPHRSSIDAAFLKLLTFENARLQRSTVCTVQHDMTAHFDRMYPSMTSLYASRYKVDKNILLSIGKTIRQLERNVETALGVSDASYSQLQGAPEIGGMVQGKADVPQLSTQQSDALLKAHESLTTGLHLPNPTGTRAITHHSVSFADDTDNHVNVNSAGTTPILEAVKKGEHSAQTWSKLVDICGGLIALHKCNWQLIAWDSSSGYMKLQTDPNTVLILRNSNMTPTILNYLPPHQPNEGLGFLLCPDGNQLPQFQSLLTAVRKLCSSINCSFLNEDETRQALRQRLVPKLTYVLHTTSFTPIQCGAINTIIGKTFLPRLRLNRHYPRAVLYGPIIYGGMAFPELHSLQCATQLEYIIKQLRWNRTVANDFLTTIDSAQLHTGVGPPLMEITTPMIKYAGPSLILSLRDQLTQIGGSLWIEDIWSPPLQREQDEFIMDRFLRIPGITTSQLHKANAVRLYLRVLTIADIAHPSGRFIPDGNLSGDWQGGSDLHWPYQPKPPPQFWAEFRRCIRHSFCTNTPSHQPTHYGMDLDTHLGKWFPVPRHSWFEVYKSPKALYWRNDTTLHLLKPTAVSGFYIAASEIDKLPLDCHPIGFRDMGDSIWTHRKYAMTQRHIPMIPPAGITRQESVAMDAQSLLIGCDASLHPSLRVATCAWVIESQDAQQTQAFVHLQNLSSFTTYRSELEGIYRSLLHTHDLGLLPQHIKQWCDNKAAIDNAVKDLYTPNHMSRPDADILLATTALRQKFANCTISQNHVYGHQDSRPHRQIHPPTSPSPSHDSFSSMSFSGNEPKHAPTGNSAVRLNILCDELAGTAAQDVIQGTYPTLETRQPPYPGSKALLRIGDLWITSHVSRHVIKAYHSTAILNYCKEKYKWSQATCDLIFWEGVGRARNRGTQTQLMQTSKIMHGWLPVNHVVGRVTHITQCPGCNHHDETMDHLFHCPNPTIRKTIDEQLKALSKFLQKSRVSRQFSSVPFLEFLLAYLAQNNEPFTINTFAQEAFQSQMDIGQHLFIRGFLSIEWLHLLRHTHHDRLENVLTNIIGLLWHEFITPIWKVRNNILHRSKNLTTSATEARLDDKLRWFLDNKTTALS